MMKLMLAVLLCFSTPLYAKYISFLKDRGQSFKLNTLETERNLQMEMVIPGVQIDKIEVKGLSQVAGVSSVKVEGLMNTTKAGSPSLPYKSVLITGHPSDLEVEFDSSRAMRIRNTLASPAPKMPCRCADDNNGPTYKINWDSYGSGRELYKLEYVGDYKGTPLTRLLIFPFRQSKVGRSLFAYPHLNFSVKSSSGRSLSVIGDALDLLQSFQDNSHYVIVGKSEFVAKMGPFIDWKEGQGFRVSTYNLEDIGDSFEEVQGFFHQLYKNDPFGYALLLGHEDLFPTQYVPTSSDPETPSDMKYFTMGGTDDRIPDVFYGRMVVKTTDEIERQIEKILEYESASWANADGLKNYIGIASDEGANPSDVEYIKSMAKSFEQGLSFESTFFFQENNDSNVTNINRAINAGAGWLNYIGHGSGESWPSIGKGAYTANDIKKLKPGMVKPIIVDVACQNGRFSYEGRLGERFINEHKNGEPIGAVAYYGGSVDISWHPPAIMAVAINKNIVKNRISRLGAALMSGQLKLVAEYDEGEEALENLVWYHLFGDPSLKLQAME